MTVIHRPPTPSGIARLQSWLPYLLLIFMLLSLFLAYQWWQTTRSWNATQSTLEETLNTLLKAQENLQAEQESNAPLRQELEDEHKDNEALRADNEDHQENLAALREELDAKETELENERKDNETNQATITTLRQDLDAKETELENERKDNETNQATIATLRQDLDAKETEMKDAQDELENTIAFYANPGGDAPQPEIIKGQGRFNEGHPSILLHGERVDHSFPRRSFYESVGVFTLDSGSWSLSANGIGGREDTGASVVSLSWNAAPQACIEQPKGFWSDADAKSFRVNCEVRFEWTVQSRYPYTTLQLMPIESVIPPTEDS